MTARNTTSKTILITGATAGIGRTTALHLARLGHRVLATGRRQPALDSLEGEADGLALTAFPLDVTDDASIAGAVETVDALTEGRGVDVLINNAGFGLTGPLMLISEADLRRQYETNVFGLVAVTRAFLPKMQARRSGRIINVTSVGGRMTFPLFGAYNSTKYAVESMSDALRNELAPFGIDVVLVEPGVIATEFSGHARSALDALPLEDSEYAPLARKADAIVAQTDRIAVGPEVIAHVMARIVRARRPRARYIAPFRAKIGLWLYQLAPTRAVDWLVRRWLGLTPGQLLDSEGRVARQLAAHG